MREIDELTQEYYSLRKRYKNGDISIEEFTRRSDGILQECLRLVDSLPTPEALEVPARGA